MKTLLPVSSLLLSLFLGQLAFALPPGSSAVNGYPTLDANRVYTPGQTVKIDEPHGVYTGMIVMDDYFFLNPLVLGDSQRNDEGQGAFASSLACISQSISTSGDANQRKLLCRNDFSLIPGAPDADRVYTEFVWI